MIITDGVHLISNTMDMDELHAFAKRIGLRQSWFQSHPVHPHYDLTTPRILNKAMLYGARIVTRKELVSTYMKRTIALSK